MYMREPISKRSNKTQNLCRELRSRRLTFSPPHHAFIFTITLNQNYYLLSYHYYLPFKRFLCFTTYSGNQHEQAKPHQRHGQWSGWLEYSIFHDHQPILYHLAEQRFYFPSFQAILTQLLGRGRCFFRCFSNNIFQASGRHYTRQLCGYMDDYMLIPHPLVYIDKGVKS